MRQESRHPEGARRHGEHGDKEERLGGEDRPENVDIADRRKPQPVDQDARDAPDDDQAADDDRNHDRDASQRACRTSLAPASMMLLRRPVTHLRTDGVQASRGLWFRRSFKSWPVPLAEVGGGLVAALQEIEQGRIRRWRRAHRVIRQDEFMHSAVHSSVSGRTGAALKPGGSGYA